jgi:hypothetical protein
MYAAMLDFLAERYSRPDKEFGRIHHWIMHNEVDAGGVWTNAGERSELTYANLYIKSVRMMYLIAGQYSSHSRVYMSLTHFWTWTEDKHFYPQHHFLDDLVEECHAEGHFDWSIAYHSRLRYLAAPAILSTPVTSSFSINRTKSSAETSSRCKAATLTTFTTSLWPIFAATKAFTFQMWSA